MISISVVDGVPLPVGEEFTGVIRVQDVRATEKDKVKIADCFRGGDVVKGVVVSLCHPSTDTMQNDISRSRLATLEATILRRPETI